jgi:NAD(P)-dependent dehydrogenase (short-subunit alcohol dehydrogenase family)
MTLIRDIFAHRPGSRLRTVARGCVGGGSRQVDAGDSEGAMSVSLSGKTALVTGASRGIGREKAAEAARGGGRPGVSTRSRRRRQSMGRSRSSPEARTASFDGGPFHDTGRVRLDRRSGSEPLRLRSEYIEKPFTMDVLHVRDLEGVRAEAVRDAKPNRAGPIPITAVNGATLADLDGCEHVGV